MNGLLCSIPKKLAFESWPSFFSKWAFLTGFPYNLFTEIACGERNAPSRLFWEPGDAEWAQLTGIKSTVENASVARYLRPFLPVWQEWVMREQLGRATSYGGLRFAIDLNSPVDRRVRYCKVCVRNQFDQFGSAGWLVVQHLPGIIACHQHGVMLEYIAYTECVGPPAPMLEDSQGALVKAHECDVWLAAQVSSVFYAGYPNIPAGAILNATENLLVENGVELSEVAISLTCFEVVEFNWHWLGRIFEGTKFHRPNLTARLLTARLVRFLSGRPGVNPLLLIALCNYFGASILSLLDAAVELGTSVEQDRLRCDCLLRKLVDRSGTTNSIQEFSDEEMRRLVQASASAAWSVPRSAVAKLVVVKKSNVIGRAFVDSETPNVRTPESFFYSHFCALASEDLMCRTGIAKLNIDLSASIVNGFESPRLANSFHPLANGALEQRPKLKISHCGSVSLFDNSEIRRQLTRCMLDPQHFGSNTLRSIRADKMLLEYLPRVFSYRSLAQETGWTMAGCKDKLGQWIKSELARRIGEKVSPFFFNTSKNMDFSDRSAAAGVFPGAVELRGSFYLKGTTHLNCRGNLDIAVYAARNFCIPGITPRVRSLGWFTHIQAGLEPDGPLQFLRPAWEFCSVLNDSFSWRRGFSSKFAEFPPCADVDWEVLGQPACREDWGFACAAFEIPEFELTPSHYLAVLKARKFYKSRLGTESSGSRFTSLADLRKYLGT